MRYTTLNLEEDWNKQAVHGVRSGHAESGEVSTTHIFDDSEWRCNGSNFYFYFCVHSQFAKRRRVSSAFGAEHKYICRAGRHTSNFLSLRLIWNTCRAVSGVLANTKCKCFSAYLTLNHRQVIDDLKNPSRKVNGVQAHEMHLTTLLLVFSFNR